jgi:hypothetical protein
MLQYNVIFDKTDATADFFTLPTQRRPVDRPPYPFEKTLHLPLGLRRRRLRTLAAGGGSGRHQGCRPVRGEQYLSLPALGPGTGSSSGPMKERGGVPGYGELIGVWRPPPRRLCGAAPEVTPPFRPTAAPLVPGRRSGGGFVKKNCGSLRARSF